MCSSIILIDHHLIFRVPIRILPPQFKGSLSSYTSTPSSPSTSSQGVKDYHHHHQYQHPQLKMVFDRRSTLLSKSTKSSYQHHPHNRSSSISRDHVTSSLYSPIRLLTLINVVLCILLLNCFAISSSLQGAFDTSEEINSVANCIGKIHKDFEQCNAKGAEKAKSYNSTVELGEEWSKRLKCCGIWKIRDCWVKAARTKCTKAQAEQVFQLPQLFMPSLVAECADYKPNVVDCTNL